MDYNEKEDLVKGLQQAMGNEVRPGYLDPDGHFVDERIAFESWTDEEKEELKDRFGAQDEAIEEERRKIKEEQQKKAQMKEVLDRRDMAIKTGTHRRPSIRSGEQFWTNQGGK